VGGIMAPELFAVSYAGAPKIVVTDFVDEVRISVVQSGAYAVDATRLHLSMKWVVSFSIPGRFAGRRVRRLALVDLF